MLQRVTYDNKKYCTMTVMFKEQPVPVIFDDIFCDIIDKISNNWKCNQMGVITCQYIQNGIENTIKMHELIMALYRRDNNLEIMNNKIVLHINKLGLDNRIDNLMYDTQNKNITKNIRKKRRRVILPNDCGIMPSELPTYVWYIKPEGTHGERFIVVIKNIRWKSSCSKKLSLCYKLEETKAYLRNLKITRPDIFNECSMNGDFNDNGTKLLESYYGIISVAGFHNIKKINLPQNTDMCLKQCDIESQNEKVLLCKNISLNNAKRTTKKRHPEWIIDLPKHCYYYPKNVRRGSYFVIKPFGTLNDSWTSSSSKKILERCKYECMMNVLNKL